MNWRDELQKGICEVEQLPYHTDLSSKDERQLRSVVDKHPMRISPYYMSLIDWNDPFDPLKRMVVPDVEELDLSGSYDTSGELESTKLSGLQHKYAQTALILVTNRCPTYCRYCFRKRLVGLETEEVLQRFADAAKYIEQHREITNVLISGGDPFILSTRVLQRFLRRLSNIPHLNFIRIGTKTPVTFPERILADRDLVALLRKYSPRQRRLYVDVQFNHPREITDRSTDAIARLTGAGVRLMNQTVLLKGVNDDPATLAELHKGLVRIGISPFYVFQCRPVKRVKRRFQLPFEQGLQIVERAKAMLDGPSKRFRFVMSHRSGKVEILGIAGDEIFLKYHQARDPNNLGRLFKRKLVPGAGWLDELQRVPAASGKTRQKKEVRLPCPTVSPHSCEPRGELFLAHECDRFRASGVHHKGEMPDHYNCTLFVYTKSRVEDQKSDSRYMTG